LEVAEVGFEICQGSRFSVPFKIISNELELEDALDFLCGLRAALEVDELDTRLVLSRQSFVPRRLKLPKVDC
jgi:hypothetical protein